jgi:hypothetical protein
LDFTDGTIEFDLSAMSAGNFMGLVFRYADGFFHENIYFRLHRSGSFEAIQYAPRVNSTAGSWQLYPEFMAAAFFPKDGWVHIRVEVSAKALELYVADAAKPAIVVARLRGTTTHGRVGFWARVSDRPEEWSAAVSNVQVKPRERTAVAAAVDTTNLPTGTLVGWQVSGPYEAADTAQLPALPPSSAWRPMPLEEDGLLNLTRQLNKPRSGRHIAFLRNVVTAARSEIARVELGFSDDVVVWLNGVPVFRAYNGFNSRYPGFLGLLTPASTEIYLPLKPGPNELVVAVAERAFGWGAKVRVLRAENTAAAF